MSSGEAGEVVRLDLFAWRATKPTDLPSDVDVAVGPDADVHIADALHGATQVICGWGRVPRPLRGPRVAQVTAMIRDAGLDPLALALTKSGEPRHPLYLRADAVPVVWHPPQE